MRRGRKTAATGLAALLLVAGVAGNAEAQGLPPEPQVVATTTTEVVLLQDEPVKTRIGKALAIFRRAMPQAKWAYKAYAKRRVGAYQFTYLNYLWMRESGWNRYADNPTSSAYGIPQSLPGSKMASEGADWRWNGYTQIDWGLKYIRGRYGTPKAAWAHSQRHNWY